MNIYFRFHINFSKIVRFDNEEQTREFISLSVGHGQPQVSNKAVDYNGEFNVYIVIS
jgi:hypothetical protein